MQTRIDEIAERIYRISTFMPGVAGPQGCRVARTGGRLRQRGPLGG
jgi:hypothetical protein